MTSKQPTIRDVARRAGLSVTAVSRHLNGQIVLPQATASRIEAAVFSLGYKPNSIARRLSRGRSETLGFVTSDIAYPFFAAIASAAEQEAGRLGYSLAIFNSRNALAQELHFFSKIEDLQVDGILFMTNHVDDGTLAARINECCHVVLLDEDVPNARVPRIFASNVEGARLGTQHLIGLGHRRIGFVAGPERILSAQERFAGFRCAMLAAGLPVDTSIVHFGVYEEESGVKAFDHLWAQTQPPTAVFCAADMLAIGVIRGARLHGVAVPAELSIVSFDDLLHVNLLDPPLTTIRQSASGFGRGGVRLLVDGLNGAPVPTEPERLPVELIVRGSAVPFVEKRRVKKQRKGAQGALAGAV